MYPDLYIYTPNGSANKCSIFKKNIEAYLVTFFLDRPVEPELDKSGQCQGVKTTSLEIYRRERNKKVCKKARWSRLQGAFPLKSQSKNTLAK